MRFGSEGDELAGDTVRRPLEAPGGPDEHAEAGGVDEVDTGEVQDDPALAGIGQLPEAATKPSLEAL
jgi:hypothetical protein